MVSNSAQGKLFKTSRNDGGAILMEKADHALTRTHGYKNSKLIVQEKTLSFEDMLKRDIKDITDNFGNKYDKSIANMLEYYKRVGRL